MNCSVFIKNSETSKIRVKNMRSLLYCSTSFASSTFPTSSIFMSETREEITCAKLQRKTQYRFFPFSPQLPLLSQQSFYFFSQKERSFFQFFFSFPQSPCSKGRDKARAIFSFLHFFCGPPVESPLAFPSVAERRPYFPEGQNQPDGRFKKKGVLQTRGSTVTRRKIKTNEIGKAGIERMC